MPVELPRECVLLNRVEIVEYINADGEFDRFALCEASDGSLMEDGKLLLLLEWCKAQHMAPMIAQIIATQINEYEYDDEDADDDDA